jgi:hypothetical protein
MNVRKVHTASKPLLHQLYAQQEVTLTLLETKCYQIVYHVLKAITVPGMAL